MKTREKRKYIACKLYIMQLCCNIIPSRCYSEHNILEKLDFCMNLYLVHAFMFDLKINKLEYSYKFSMFFFIIT